MTIRRVAPPIYVSDVFIEDVPGFEDYIKRRMAEEVAAMTEPDLIRRPDEPDEALLDPGDGKDPPDDDLALPQNDVPDEPVPDDLPTEDDATTSPVDPDATGSKGGS